MSTYKYVQTGILRKKFDAFAMRPSRLLFEAKAGDVHQTVVRTWPAVVWQILDSSVRLLGQFGSTIG